MRKAYGFEDPVFRKVVPVDTYVRRGLGRFARIEGFRVDKVEVTGERRAVAYVVLKVDLHPPGARRPMVINYKMKDKWVLYEGEWYHVAE